MSSINSFIESVKAFYEIIHDGIIITNLTGKISYLNKSACTLLKCNSKNKLKNSDIDNLFLEKNYLDQIIPHLATNKSFIVNKTCIKTDKSQEDYTLCFSLINLTGGEPIGFLIILKNSFLQDNEQNYFEKHSSLLHALNYHSGQIIFISDLQNKRNVYCSQSVEKITGWTQKDYNDGGWAFAMSLTHPDDVNEMIENYSKEMELRTREKNIHDHRPIVYQYRQRHKDGSWLNIHSESLILERDKNNDPLYFITFSKNVSDSSKEKIGMDDENDHVHHHLEKILTDEIPNNKKTSIRLSDREKEILKLVKKGLSTKEIADILNLKITSVNSYRKNLMSKLNAKNSAELVQKSNQFIIV